MPLEESDIIIITEEEAGERLDKILAARYHQIRSRTYFQYLLDEHKVLLNGQPVKKRIRPNPGDEVEIAFLLEPELELIPEHIPLDILYEDEHLLAINKPAGLVVHPALGHWTGTFANALLYHCQQLDKTGSLRPGIVHRLDKDTTGILLAAKNAQAQQKLIELFASRQIYKEYLALCLGNPGNAIIDQPIGRHPVHRKKMAVLEEGGRNAQTHCRTLAFDNKLSYVRLILATGRTHQLRVHMQHHGTPILGDPVYGNPSANKKYGTTRQMLHAHILRFKHPLSNVEMELKASLPADMNAFIAKLEKLKR